MSTQAQDLCGKKQMKYTNISIINEENYLKSLSVQDMRKILAKKTTKNVSKLTRLELCQEMIIYLKSPPQPKSTACTFGLLKKTLIYHIVKNKREEMKFQDNERIIYKSIRVSQDQDQIQFENQLVRNIKENCAYHNILIYFSSINTPRVTISINNILQDDNADVHFNNTTIINLLEDSNNDWIFAPRNRHVKKIVNQLYDSKIQLEISKSLKKKLTDQWWFKKYFKLPPCSYGRLLQISGTCWFNSTFNALMLVPKIAEIMKLKWSLLPLEEKNKVIEMGSLDRCLSKTAPLKTLLFVMIHFILVKGEKPKYEQGNWIKEVAGYVKSVALTRTESTYRNLKVADLQNNTNFSNSYADGSSTSSAIRIILETLFVSYEYKIVTISYLPEYKSMHKDSKNFDNYGKFWNELQVLPLLIIVHVPPELSSLKKSMIINNTQYSLESGVMGISGEIGSHAVSMLRCEERWYIYDSNNILIECDWHKGDIGAYKETFGEYANNSTFFISYVIYVRETF